MHRFQPFTLGVLLLQVIGAGVLGVGVLGVGVVGCDRPRGEADPPVAEGVQERPPVLVEVEPAGRGRMVDTVTLSGDLQAENRVSLTSRIQGVVESVPVREGMAVQKGQLLVLLEEEEWKLALREKGLALRDAQQQAESSTHEVTEAQQNVEVKRLAYEKARKELDRIQRLMTGDAPSAMTVEEAEARRYTSEEARLAHESAKVAASRAVITQAVNALAIDRAELARDKAQLELDRCRIVAPLAGSVSYLEIRPGELIQQGAQVVDLINTEDIYTEVRVPQRRLPTLEVGQVVEVRAETYPDRMFTGEVQTIHPTVDPDQGTVKVRVKVDDPDRVLRPGIYVTATIVLDVRDRALVLPKRARLFDGNESVVFVIQDGRAVRVPIRIGLETSDTLEVLGDDIREGDSIVVRGQTQLRPGDAVEIKDATSSGSPEPATAGAASSDRDRG